MFRDHHRGKGMGRHGWRERYAEGPAWFGPRGRRGPFGPFFGRGGPFGDDPFGGDEGPRRRHRRGDIKYALLELLAEQPRHGYELIKELESRYGGFYRPSPGSVYPTLQLLEDEGHLTSEQVEGKRVYTITEAGRKLLEERRATEGGEPWQHGGPGGSAEHGELRRGVMALLEGVMQVARHGTPEQMRAVLPILERARREIYALLAGNQ